MKGIKEYINENISVSYRFDSDILYGNLKKELHDMYDFEVRGKENYEVQDKIDKIVKYINGETNNFIKNVGKENIKYVKYNTVFLCLDFAKSLSNTDIPIIKSKFIENNYNSNI